MITEDYVNKQIALLLREKGFDEPTLYHYNGDNKEPTHTINYDLLKNSELKEFCSTAPTVQMVMKWLREVHKIDICVFPCHYDYNTYGYECKIYVKKSLYLTLTEYKTYEEACNDAIEYSLKHLI